MRRIFLVAFALSSLTALAQPFMPADHRALTKSISYPEMKNFLESVDGKGPVRVSVEGTTTQGRNVYLVRLGHAERAAWNILFYAQQHGDEISGKDAALYLIREIAAHPERLPADTAVWILPMMNPDGAEAGTRVNAAGADLNRDHMTLLQPETQALYRVVRRVLPDIAVDCHEFGRSGSGWQKRGWEKWPDITMDGLNNPMFDAARRAAAERWVSVAGEAAKAAGHPFLRYWVGGVPPDEEQRHSAPDMDSGLNGIGAYGGLSFIIEAAARGEEDTAKELGNRVDAYLALLRRFVSPSLRVSASPRETGSNAAAQGEHRAEDAAVIAQARVRSMPRFIPVNYLWANPEGTVTNFPVTRVSDGKTIEIPTANKMTAIVVKKSVATPAAYAVEARAASEFRALLERQAIPFETLTAARNVYAEACTLLRVEEEFDEVYARYGGRQIVRCEEAATRALSAGSLIVPIEGPAAMRAALLLEPQTLYGLFVYPLFRAMAGEGGVLPVLRVMP